MQIKTVLLSLAVMSGGCMLSCTSDDLTVSRDESYTREFIKTFGVASRSHDWNLAVHSSVSVITSVPTNVRVYAEVSGRRYLFADYRKVTGSVDIPLTLPKRVREVIVSASGRETRVALGQSVDLTRMGRTVADAAGEGGSGITAELITNRSQWMVVPMLNATIFRRKMPENCYNADREGVHNDFMMLFKENDIIVRPLYWQTSHVLEFGLYYDDENGEPVKFPIYQMEKGTEKADLSDKVLCWVPSNTKSVIIKNFLENDTIIKCLADNNVEVIDRNTEYNVTYSFLNLNSLDNKDNGTQSIDDRNMTRACAEYLRLRGFENKEDAPADKRYNYIYRWHFVGDGIVGKSAYGYPTPVYDNAFLSKDKNPKQDLELVYTYYNYDYDNNADGWPNASEMTQNVPNGDNDYPSLISKGIKVHIEDISRPYGGYIRRDDGVYLYSSSTHNDFGRFIPKEGAVRGSDDNYSSSDMLMDETQRCFRSVTWVGTKYEWRYMSFEDGRPSQTYNPNECDFDMQDFVFVLDGAIDPQYDDPVKDIIPGTPEVTPYEWIIAAEDLGGTFDWDFNDLVVKVSCVSVNYADADGEAEPGVEYSRVTVTPLASGGTLPIYLMYTGALYDTESHSSIGEDTYVINRELHSWLGVPHSQPVNVGSRVTNSGKSVTYYVPGIYSLAVHDRYDGTGGKNNMGGLWVLVAPFNSPFTVRDEGVGELRHFDVPDGEGVHSVTAPIPDDDSALAPQMICVGGEWLWPRELHDIRKAYPVSLGPGFMGWMNDSGIKDAWYAGDDRHDPSHVVSR